MQAIIENPAVGAAAKCSYATYVVSGQVTLGVTAGTAYGGAVVAFLGGAAPAGVVFLVGAGSASYLYAYNVEYTEQLVAYCLGLSGPPTADSTYDVFTPFIPPLIPPPVPQPGVQR